MLNLDYYRELKEYFQNDYNGVVASDKAVELANEMYDMEATFLNYHKPWDPEVISEWIDDTEANFNMDDPLDPDDEDYDEDLEEEKVLVMFPSFNEYYRYRDEIASYIMWKHLNEIRESSKAGNEKYIDMIIALDWNDMIPESLQELFIF